MKKDFASYEKNIESTITKIRHIIRIRLNSTRFDIEDSLKNVPLDARVSMIVDDPDGELGSEYCGYGEIHFVEEHEKE